jgi:propanediol dehydratase small subunit
MTAAPIGFSGRPASEITIDALRNGELGADDVRIHRDTLERQAQVAEQHANRQLADNFRRAAELTAVPDDQVMAMYEALRPRRSTGAQLEAVAADLDRLGAERCAALVREAAAVYARRGLLA